MRRVFLILLSLLLLAALLACGLPELQQLLIGTPSAAVPTTPSEASPGSHTEDCLENALVNGSFEEGAAGWTYSGTEHGRAIPDLPLTQSSQNVHSGENAALLGGFETASDNLSQTFIVPAGGQLSLWWMYHSPDPIQDRDTLLGRLVLPGNEDGLPLFYAGGDIPQDTWQQTLLDLSTYAGQRLTLEFSTYNDNYYASWLVIDDICIQATP